MSTAPLPGCPVAMVEPVGEDQYEIVWEVEHIGHPISTGPLLDAHTHGEAERARDAIQAVLNRHGDPNPERSDDILRAAGVK